MDNQSFRKAFRRIGGRKRGSRTWHAIGNGLGLFRGVEDHVTTSVHALISEPPIAIPRHIVLTERPSGAISLVSVLTIRESAEVWLKVSEYMFP